MYIIYIKYYLDSNIPYKSALIFKNNFQYFNIVKSMLDWEIELIVVYTKQENLESTYRINDFWCQKFASVNNTRVLTIKNKNITKKVCITCYGFCCHKLVNSLNFV